VHFLISELLILLVLARNVRLYPSVKVTGQSYVGVKRCTVPNQSLSLREIVKRFVRRESLPISQQGLYEERFGDLEKMSKADIFDQFEKVKELKEQIKGFNDREKARADKAKADALASPAPPPIVGTVGEQPLSGPPPKGA